MTLSTNNKIKFLQPAIITFVWVLLFAVPLLFGNFPDGTTWEHIFKIWKEYGLLFLLFLINRLILMPYLFFKGKRIAYFATASVLTLALLWILYVNFNQNQMERRIEARELRRDLLQDRPPRHPLAPRPAPVPSYANLFILSILIFGFDTGLNISMRWVASEQNRIQLEKENTENKLAFLRNQISPHFFMNTLNNIHAQIDYNADEAKSSIIKLSHLMGYLLYETQENKVSLQKEIQFIKSYIELMQLRYSNKVKIEVFIPEALPKVSIPPLLFISFIENAFKYGISYQNPSFIHIVFLFEPNNLYFEVSNTVHKRDAKSEHSGLGIKNTRHRLDLIYGNNYSLNINELPESFNVKLNIPI
jgi:hypothetical protein